MHIRDIYRGPIFSLIQKDMIINGVPTDRDIIIHNGGVSLICTDENRILLVKQTRAAAQSVTLEIPAGTLEPNEDPAACGLRELNEETGMTCSGMKLVTAFWPTPGYDTEVIWIYRCQDCRKAEHLLQKDADEDTQSVWMDIQEAWRQVCSGKIRDGKTIIALQHLLLEQAGLLEGMPEFDSMRVHRGFERDRDLTDQNGSEAL